LQAGDEKDEGARIDSELASEDEGEDDDEEESGSGSGSGDEDEDGSQAGSEEGGGGPARGGGKKHVAVKKVGRRCCRWPAALMACWRARWAAKPPGQLQGPAHAGGSRACRAPS
jgi:hypothetical protein